MDDMGRKHGNGSFDKLKRQFKLRTTELKAKACIWQLAEMFKVDLGDDERKAWTYWLKYLAELRRLKVLSDADAELEAAKVKYKDHEPPEYSHFERDLRTGTIRLKQRPDFDTINLLNAAAQIANPDTEPEVRDWLLGNLRAGIEPPKNESLKHEIEQYIEGYKKKGGKQWYEIKRCLDLLFEACGNISFRAITAEQYREFLKILDREQKSEHWTDRTKQNRQRAAHTFLKHLEADYSVIYSFIRNSKYRIEVAPIAPEDQVKYTVEQVKTALANATGISRTALLLGLNCGFYASDIAELERKHFDGVHITKSRAKNKRNGVRKGFVGKWRLWPETVQALQYGLSRLQVERNYLKLREKYDLPEHMALRKTVAQWIHESHGEEVSKNLYRAEGYGTHYNSYVCMITDAQMEKLNAALEDVHKKIFGG